VYSKQTLLIREHTQDIICSPIYETKDYRRQNRGLSVRELKIKTAMDSYLGIIE
jgi:hypothetical protein